MISDFPLDRWSEADRVFDAALELPEAERRSYVEQVCGDDEALLREVLSLLHAEQGSRHFLGGLSEMALSPVLHELATEADGVIERIGRYRVIGEIGRGGWGTVYEAARDAGDFDQRVAIKILRRGLDTDDVLARFRTEGQILGSLSHPGIARLLDGGATDDGRPYLVMELVEGLPITRYCEEQRLTIEQRLRLFVAVGRAVEYAHRNLVVHRDLKPSNILVTQPSSAGGVGDVKLLDFGIAKLLDPAQADATPKTSTGVRPMTPEYASPEQVTGEPITTASDVYQLGLLLYELLTGCRPFPETGSGRRLQDVTTRQEPPPPSTRVRSTLASGGGPGENADLRRLRRKLRGDLDAIPLQALRREPERRYRSVAELVEDVERFLSGQPVRARPDTLAYRTGKLLRRRPGAVAVGAAVCLAVIIYTGTLRVHAAQLEQERNHARIEAEKARHVAGFMADVFTLSGPNVTKGEQVTARELLDEAARRLRTHLTDQPPVRAALLSAVARVYQEYGLSGTALELYSEAVSVREPLATVHAAEHAADLRAMAHLLERQHPERSDSLYREALALAEDHAGPSHAVVGGILVDFGHSLSYRDSAPRDSVWQMYRRAVEIFRGADSDVRKDLAHALTISAYGTPRDEEWFDGSTPLERMREALDLRIDLYGEESIDVAASMSDLALALEEVDSDESVTLLNRAVSIMDRLVQKRHRLALTLLNNLAAVHQDRGEHELAEPLLREVIALYEEIDTENNSRAYPLSHLGSLLNRQGRGAEAEPLLRESIERMEALGIGRDDPRILITRSRLATSLIVQGRYEAAERELLSIDQRIRSADGPPAAQIVLETLVRLYDTWGKADEAENARSELAALQARA